jgi:NAD+ kinase
MRKKIQQVTVLLNRKKSGARRLVSLIQAILKDEGVSSVWVDKYPSERKLALHYGDLETGKSEMVLALGGDGTLLNAARRTQGRKIPLLGINAGSLGFLTSFPADHLEEKLPDILQGGYFVSERQALRVELKRKGETVCRGWALNEVVINRGNHAHMVRVRVRVSGQELGQYLCDGLIVATPTGSTAYSLSAGGPILSPASEAVLITPICAHALGIRPIVISSDETVQLEVPKNCPALFLQTDGLTCARLRAGDQLLVRVASEPVLLACPGKSDFYSVLRQKLGWSGASI